MAPRQSGTVTELRGEDKAESFGSQPRWNTLDEWLSIYGDSEYMIWTKNNPSERLSYDEWCASEHVLGPYLYHATLNVWDNSTTTDEDEDSEEEVDSPVSPEPQKHAPTKTVTRNNKENAKITRTPKSATVASQNDPETSGKRRRKPRKKYLSEEIVASDESEDVENSKSAVDITPSATSAKPNVNGAANGRRKSSTRKPKKKFLSEETISPEDMEDEPETIDEVITTPVILSNIPVRPSPRKAAVGTEAAENAKKNAPKTGSGRKPRKKYLSEAVVQDEDSEDENPNIETPASSNATVNQELDTPSAAADQEDSSPSSRRGLRVRTPAQQRPYFHHAKLFEEQEPNDSSSKTRVSGLSHVLYADDKDEEAQSLSDANNEQMDDPNSPPLVGHKPKYFKGKGRAWKKGEEDEDFDFAPKKNKPQKGPKQKKGGRPRKSLPKSEAAVQAPPESKAEMTENWKPTQNTEHQARGRGPILKISFKQNENEEGSGAATRRTASTISHKRARAPTLASNDDVQDQIRDGNDEERHETQQPHSSPSRKMQKRASPASPPRSI